MPLLSIEVRAAGEATEEWRLGRGRDELAEPIDETRTVGERTTCRKRPMVNRIEQHTTRPLCIRRILVSGIAPFRCSFFNQVPKAPCLLLVIPGEASPHPVECAANGSRLSLELTLE